MKKSTKQQEAVDFHPRVVHLHLLVYPGLKVADVAMDTDVVLRAALPPDCVASQPPSSLDQGHQRAAALRLAGR